MNLSRIRMLQPLRQRNFGLLAFAWTVSLLGDGFFQVANAWQAYQISNLPTALAVVGASMTASIVIFSLIGGAVTDRFDRRYVMIAADVVRAVAVGLIGFLSIAGILEIWHMVVLNFFVGVGDAFFNPASTALVPDIVAEDDLAQTNAFRGAVRPLAMNLVGPAIAGVMIGAVGPGPAFLIDGATFLLSAVAILFIQARPLAQVAGGIRATIAQINEGLTYARQTTWLWLALLSGIASIIFFTGPRTVLLPYVVKNDLNAGADALGWIYAVGGAAAVVFSVVVGQIGIPKRAITAMYLGWAGCVGSIALFGWMDSLWQGLIASIVQQSLFAFTVIIWYTLLQKLVPPHLLGRVSSLDWLFSTALAPLSYLLTAPLAETFGARATLVGAGVLGIIVSLTFIFLPGALAPERTPRPVGLLAK